MNDTTFLNAWPPYFGIPFFSLSAGDFIKDFCTVFYADLPVGFHDTVIQHGGAEKTSRHPGFAEESRAFIPHHFYKKIPRIMTQIL